MAQFDYTKTYYKVTNEYENHNGYQYKDGLNVLKEKFNDDSTASCVSGGFYFTDYENLAQFLGYGVWIREISIPKDARVIKDPDGDKWRTNKIILGNKYHINNDFDKWFDKDKYDWYYSYYLPKFCLQHFNKWFDSKKYNWKYSEYLAEYCSEYFDKWFDPEKYDWEYSHYLAQYCSKHFNKWFDSEKFNRSASRYLAQYCFDHFDKWFNPEEYEWYFSEYLAEYCPQYFDKWFDPKKFNWYHLKYLARYCSEYRNKWEKYIPKYFKNEKYRYSSGH